MRHANLPLQVLAPSVAFAPQCSTSRFLWRGISASATAGVAPLVHSHGTCSALAARKPLRQRLLGVFCVRPRSFSLDPQPLRQGADIAGCIRASSDAADTREDAPILYQEQSDDAGRINEGCDRDGSRAAPQCITGVWHPRSSVILRLATTGHVARMLPAPLARAAVGTIFAGTAAQGPMRLSVTAATTRWAARTITAETRCLVRAQDRSADSRVPLPDISMCSSCAWPVSHAARSGLTLAAAADDGPAIHRCSKYRTVSFVASESWAESPLSSSKRVCQATFTRASPMPPQSCGTEPLGYVKTISCGL